MRLTRYAPRKGRKNRRITTKRPKKQKGGAIGMDQIPHHHRLAKFLVEEDNVRQMYGTSHIRKILEKDGRIAEQKELDKLEEDAYAIRKAYLEDRIGVIYDEKEQVVGFKRDPSDDLFHVPSDYTLMFYLSYRLSPETINTLRPFYERVRSTRTKEDSLTFMKHAFSIMDYVVNIEFIYEPFFKLSGSADLRRQNEVMYEVSKKIDKWIHKIVLGILSNYQTPKDKKNRYLNVDEQFSMIPAGTRLYRGFKKRRGPLNIERDFSFFVWDAVNCIFYILPSEDGFYNDERESHVEMYCAQVGGVAEVRTTKDLRLLNLSKASAVRHLLANMQEKGAPQKVIKYLKEGWILSNNNPDKYTRKSVYDKDMDVVKWLQKNGYHGYVAMDVDGLHDEIVLFDIKNSVAITHIYGADELNMPLCTEPYISLGIGLFAN